MRMAIAFRTREPCRDRRSENSALTDSHLIIKSSIIVYYYYGVTGTELQQILLGWSLKVRIRALTYSLHR